MIKKENDYNIYLKFAKKCALHAGKIMRKFFNAQIISEYKSDRTIVTLADIEINKYLVEQVKQKFPEHSIDGEEEQFGNSDFVWVCDPVDGTAQFARGIPVAVYSLALVVKGEPIVGVVYDPFTNNLYYAVKGQGAYKNNDKIKLQVSDINLDDMRSVAHYDMYPAAEYDLFKAISILGEKTYFVSIGSVARACMAVADGHYNLVIFPGTLHKNCDFAAAKVIVEEAGGVVKDLFGKEQRYDCDITGAVACNQVVYKEVMNVLSKNMKKRS